MMAEDNSSGSDILKLLTCWPPIDYVESCFGRLAVFALSAGAAHDMREELSERLLGGELSAIQFARAVSRYSCFPADRLREGIGRPNELILTEDQCLLLSIDDLEAICTIFLRGELEETPTGPILSWLRDTYLQKWIKEKEERKKELQRFWSDLRLRLEQVEKDGFQVDNLSSEELVRLLRRPEARESYERFRDVATIAQHGWFIDLDWPIRYIQNSAETLRSLSSVNYSKGTPSSLLQEIDVSAVSYFETRYEKVKKSILSHFKARSHILGPAFAAHEQGLYCLSIPVFIAQADGIFRELRGFELFSSYAKGAPDDYREMRKHIMDGIYDRHEISWSDFLPLLFHSGPDVSIPFNMNTNAEQGQCEGYNRHAIMHGLCTFYGIKENSLRYISLLGLLRLLA